jgi:hypothetical protein
LENYRKPCSSDLPSAASMGVTARLEVIEAKAGGTVNPKIAQKNGA